MNDTAIFDRPLDRTASAYRAQAAAARDAGNEFSAKHFEDLAAILDDTPPDDADEALIDEYVGGDFAGWSVFLKSRK